MVTPRSYTRGKTRKNGTPNNSKRALDAQHRMDARYDARADAIMKEYNKVVKQIKTAKTKLDSLNEKKRYLEKVVENFNHGEKLSTSTNNRRRFGDRQQRSMARRMHDVEHAQKYGLKLRF